MKQIFYIAITSIMTVLLTSCNAETNKQIDKLPLIDVHAHTFKQSPQVLINLARREKLEKIYIISRLYRDHLPVIRANSDVARLLIYPDTKQPGWLKKAEAFILDNRDVVAGVKLHPSVDKYIAGLPNLAGLFASAEKNRFVIVTHTDSSKYSHAENFRPLLVKHPSTRLVLYHAYPVDNVIKLINDFPHVYTDISHTAFNGNVQRKVLTEAGADKIVFGIDTPIGWPKDSNGNIKRHYRNVVRAISKWYDKDKNVMEKILYKNARKLFSE